MKKILLLFGEQALANKKANPETLCQLLDAAGTQEATYTYSLFEDLAFYVSDEGAAIWDMKNGYDIADFDFVYFRKWEDQSVPAMACTVYLKSKRVAFIDRELDRPGALDKLTQHWKLWEAGLSIPSTLYVPLKYIDKLSEQKLSELGLSAPFIVKSADGTRGKDNYLAADIKKLKATVNAQPDIRFLIQNFIPNDGDFRVIVGGDQILMVIKRQAPPGSHKNNTSQGGQATLVSKDIFTPEVQADAIEAARAFRRDLAGVDLVFNKETGKHSFLEVNRAPQVDASSFSEEKSRVLHKFFMDEIEKNRKKKAASVIGRVEKIGLPDYGIKDIHARVDTGAKTSAIWASDIARQDDGSLSFHLFDKGSPYYNGQKIIARSFTETVVASSMGLKQKRYKVKMTVSLKGRKIHANFTLADRSQQVYPVLIGRNVLHGKFVVDVTRGDPLQEAEDSKTNELRKILKSGRKDA